MSVGYFTGRITIAAVRAAKPAMIFYGANTCWWTHDARHLGRHASGLPCDPRGGMLFQTEDVEAFLADAERNATFYGKHGLKAFEAAHHVNCTVGVLDPRPTCFSSWDDYNRILDEQHVP